MNILVSGLINVETSVPVKEFPVTYFPIDYLFGGISSNVSGVGFNIAKALAGLGDNVDMVSLIGKDFYGDFAVKQLKEFGINTRLVKKQLDKTCHSVVLYDNKGNNEIFCDLKDVQDKTYIQNADKALMRSEMAVLCNINFSRSLLSRAKQLNIPIATDCHVLSDPLDAFNADFMKYADILFLSNEAVKGNEKRFIERLNELYDAKIIVMGMGKDGAMMYSDESNRIQHYPAANIDIVSNSTGAGDAMFACFIHYYSKDKNSVKALQYAQTFAYNKIHSDNALTEDELEKLITETL